MRNGSPKGHHGLLQGAIVGALALFLIVVVWQPIEISGWLMGVLVLAGLLVGAALMGNMVGLPQGQKPESPAEDFASVADMRVNLEDGEIKAKIEHSHRPIRQGAARWICDIL